MNLTLRQAELAVGTPSSLRAEVRAALRNDDFYSSVSGYFSPPGMTGSKAYDQGIAVQKLLDWDAAKNGGKINAYKASHRELWVHIYAVLSTVFQTSHGRVIGLLEVKPKDPEATEAKAAVEAASPSSGGDIE